MTDKPPSTPSPVSVPTHEPNPRLKSFLDRLKERVDGGDVNGLVVLVACPGREFAHVEAGEYEIGDIMLAFEDWKFAEMKRLSND